MTKRQLEVLRMVREVIQKGEAWINLGLSKGGTPQISWEEVEWMSDFQKQSMLTRIDAHLLVDEVVRQQRGEGGSLEGWPEPRAEEFCSIEKKGAEVAADGEACPHRGIMRDIEARGATQGIVYSAEARRFENGAEVKPTAPDCAPWAYPRCVG